MHWTVKSCRCRRWLPTMGWAPWFFWVCPTCPSTTGSAPPAPAPRGLFPLVAPHVPLHCRRILENQQCINWAHYEEVLWLILSSCSRVPFDVTNRPNLVECPPCHHDVLFREIEKMKAFPLVSIPPYKNKSPKIITLAIVMNPTIGHTTTLLIYRWYRLERGEEHESNRTHQHFDTIIKPSSLNWTLYCMRERGGIRN